MTATSLGPQNKVIEAQESLESMAGRFAGLSNNFRAAVLPGIVVAEVTCR
jgi:hypothetical protein